MNYFKRLFVYIQHYKFNSILVKNFIIIILLFLIPLSSITFLMYKNMNETVKEEISLINKNSLYRVRDVIDNVFKDVNEMAIFFSKDLKAQNFLVTDQYRPLLHNQYKDLYHMFDMYTFVYDYVDSIYMYSEINKRTISNDLDKDITWQEDYVKNNHPGIWINSRKKRNIYPYLLTYIQPIYRRYYQDLIGSVIINIDMEELSQLIRKNESTHSEDILIVDKDQNIIFTYHGDLFLKNIKDVDIYKHIQIADTPYSGIMDISGSKYAVSTVPSSDYDWVYIAVQPLQHYEKELQVVINYILFLLTICFVLALIITVFISIKTFSPVVNILSIFENPDNLNRFINNKDKDDEIKFIAQNIIQTIFSNRELKEELESRLKTLNQAQMVALQAQMNPHFLYNTLETIRWLVVELTQKENEPSRMIASLSKLLRLSLDSKEQLISIKEEISHAKFYIDIMKVRYGEKLNVKWEISEDILDNKIVKFVLQPLIENAIYHGIKYKKDNGIIVISGKRYASYILLTIADDGTGMEPKRIQDTNAKLEEIYTIHSEHIGIYNVNQRIKLVFGEKYGLKLVNGLNQGVIVEIRIPS
ncbi:histidine kinase [Vallitalea pronyensis]|uniref:Histidine kinase n=1 Tax=Vallitalea pronyensis TaxID=1348613 RepID=A0A8J8SHN8_9FIRM|nr:sensor histidine kinase [Vallitalea pronyensis]QUI23771.1 histidine kinase [Vallitalea pronyensis]